MPTTNDNVVQHPDIQQLKSRLQPLRYALVCRAWLRHAGGMVVRKNDGGRTVLQRTADDFSRVNRRSVQRAHKQIITLNQAMLGIQKQATEDFALMGAQVVLQKPSGLLGAGQHARCTHGLKRLPPGYLKRRLKLDILGIAQPPVIH